MTRVGLEFFGVDAGAKAQCQAAIDQLAELRTATTQQTAAAQESADVTVAGARAKVESLVQERATLRENLAAYQQLAAAATAGSEEQIAATKLATDAQAKLGVEIKATAVTARTAAAGIGTASAAAATQLKKILTPVIAIGAAAGYLDYQFNLAMQHLRTSAGASQAEVDRMSKALLAMAKTAAGAGQSPVKLANALYFLESANIRGEKALGALSAAAVNAATTGADLTDTVKALAAARKVEIAGAEDDAKAMGVLNATVGAGMMTLQDLTAALSTGILPAAKNVGITLPQVGAAIDTMTIAGQSAQQSATKLTATFLRMLAPTGAAAKGLAALGIKSQDLGVALQRGGLTAALGLLVKKYNETATASGKVYASQQLMTAFGRARGGSAILTLVEGWNTYNKALGQVNRTTGDYMKNSKAAMETEPMKIKVALAAIKASLTEMGGKILPTAATAARDLAKIVQTVASAFRGWGKVLAALVIAAVIGKVILLTKNLGLLAKNAVLAGAGLFRIAAGETAIATEGVAANTTMMTLSATVKTLLARLVLVAAAFVAIHEGVKKLSGDKGMGWDFSSPTANDTLKGSAATAGLTDLFEKLDKALGDAKAQKPILQKMAQLGLAYQDLANAYKTDPMYKTGAGKQAIDAMLARYKQIAAKVPRIVAGRPLAGTAPGVGTHAQSDWQSANAIDIEAKEGDSVRSPEDGSIIKISGTDPSKGVVASGTKRLYGWSVTIQGASGTQYFITHLLSVSVKAGQAIKAGQEVGKVGNIGHIHFAVSKGSPWTAAGYQVPKGAPASWKGGTGTAAATTTGDTRYNPPAAAETTGQKSLKTAVSDTEATARTMAKQLGGILSPSLKSKLAKEVKALQAELEDVGSQHELSQIKKKMTLLEREIKAGVSLTEPVKEAKKQAKTLAASLENIVSPTLRASLRKSVQAVQKELEDIGSKSELDKVKKKIQTLTKDIKDALSLNPIVKQLRAQAKALGLEIGKLPGDLSSPLMAKLDEALKKLGDVTSKAAANSLKKQLAKLLDEYDAAVQTLSDKVDKSTASSEAAFSKLEDKTFSAFDAETQAGLDSIDTQTQALLDNVDTQTKALIDAAEKANALPTPGEQRLTSLQALQTTYSNADTLAADQAALEAAHKLRVGWDATEAEKEQAIAAAERQLRDDQLAQEIDAAQTQADAERKAADDALAIQEQAYQDQADAQKKAIQDAADAQDKAYEDQRDALRDYLQDRFDAIQAEFETGEPAAIAQAQSDLAALLADPEMQGLFADSGSLIGQCFAASFAAELTDVQQTLADLWLSAETLADATGSAPITYTPSGGGSYLTIPGYAGGGDVPGPRFVARRDTVLAKLTPGEGVLTPGVNQALKEYLAAGGGGDLHVHLHGPVFGGRRKVADELAGDIQSAIDRRIRYRSRRA
jgi:TP901 family phage tail tape measure protein